MIDETSIEHANFVQMKR